MINEDVIKAGWLTKQGGSVKTWKTRWVVLQGTVLLYFKNEKLTQVNRATETLDEKVRKGVIPVSAILDIGVVKIKNQDLLQIKTKDRIFIFKSDVLDLQSWKDAIQSVLMSKLNVVI